MTLYRGIPIEEVVRRFPQPKILFPNEHGAWGMFFTAFLLGWLAAPEFSWRPLALLPAALGLFLTRYPIGLYFKKRRITRALKIPLTREKKWFLMYALLTVMVTIPLFYPLRWWWLLPFGALAAVIFILHLKSIKRREERTFLAEASGMIGLSLLAPAASYAAILRLHWEMLFVWFLLVSFNLWRIASVRGRVARKKEEGLDVRAVGKRELKLSSIFLMVLIVVIRFFHVLVS